VCFFLFPEERKKETREITCCSGNPLEPLTTKYVRETGIWRRIELRYRNNVKGLGNPHGYNLKALVIASPRLAVRD